MEPVRRNEKLFFLFLIFGFGLLLLIVTGFQLIEFTESSTFCGQTCHNVMAPEYTAYQDSPHYNVACASCHVGPGAGNFVKSKIQAAPEVWGEITGKFPRPIPAPVENLPPAQQTCANCHPAQEFRGDVLDTRTTFLTDEANTPEVNTRILHVGGGSVGNARGIHWHVAAKVWYLAANETRQNIAWIGVENETGGYATEYANPQYEGSINSKQIASGRRLMDCTDCHNRTGHNFPSPGQLIDAAMVQGTIDKSLPFIKREGARALYPPNPSLDQAYSKLNAISDFYKTNYPQVYAGKKDSIDKSIIELKNIAGLTTFPDMKVNWDTYANNIGHQQTDGCFRCHGKLVATTGKNTGKAVVASCDTCHNPITP